jgi:hypothetical protein
MMMHPLKQCFLYSDHNDLMSRKKQAHALSAGMHFLGPCPPARIQRFKMRLMRFDFSISHVAGKDLNIADTLSRAPVENMSQSDTDFENETKAFMDVVMSL